MTNLANNSLAYKALYMFLAIGLASRCIEKGVEAGFIGLAIIISAYIGIKHFTGNRQSQLTDKIKSSSHNPLFYILVLMLTSWGVSSFFGIKPDYNLAKWGEILAVVLGGAILYVGVRLSPLSAMEKFPRYVMWAIFAFSCLLILESLNVIPWVTEHIRNTAKGPLHTQIRSFSAVVAICIPFAWVEIMKKDKPKYWFISLIILIAALISGGRSGWLALSVGAVSFAILYPWKTIKRPRLNFSLFWGHLIAGSAIGLWLYKHIVGASFFSHRINMTAEGVNATGNGSGRIEIWRFALEKFPESPWFGIGVKGFRHLDFTEAKVASTMHPHNALIELLVETGIVGALLALIFVGLLLYRLARAIYYNKTFKNPRSHNIAIGCSCALISFLVASLTLTSIFHAWWLVYFVIIYIIIDSASIAITRNK